MGKKNLKPDFDSPGNILYGNPDAFDLPCDLETRTMIFRLQLLIFCFTSNFTEKKNMMLVILIKYLADYD